MTQPNPNRDCCLFCGAALANGRAKEHVFPQWLLDHLGIRHAPISPTHLAPDGTVRSSREHALENLKEGRVCAICNSGWMSELEGTAKPILVALFDTTRQVIELSSVERLLIARWAAKTAYALNSASNFGQHVPLEHYASLKHCRVDLPNRVAVFAQQHHGKRDFYWYQGAVWNAVGHDLGPMNELAKSTYKISLQFAKLLLLVAWWPHDGWRYTLNRGVHVPLWPQRGPMAWYESADFPWDDSEAALAAFHAGLWLQQGTPAAGGGT